MISLINKKKKNLLSNSQNCKVRLTTVGFMDGRHFGEISMKKKKQSVHFCLLSVQSLFFQIFSFIFIPKKL